MNNILDFSKYFNIYSVDSEETLLKTVGEVESNA